MGTSNDIKASAISILRDLQKEGKKLFISFVFGLLLSIIVLRAYAWEFFESVMRSNMSETLGEQVNIIAQTPFEVLLVQGKIGLFVGLVFTVPSIMLILDKKVSDRNSKLSNIPRRALYISVLFGIILFGIGLWYSYYVFFPVVFEFLASATVQTGVQPMYSIARWTQFMVLLSLSFGIIAQIPVSIPTLVRYEVISYQRVRNYIRFWIAGTLVVGAVLSPPEPISQLMWSVPLICLYVVAMVISKYIDPRRGEEIEDERDENSTLVSSDDVADREEDTGFTDDDVESDIGGYYAEISQIGRFLRSNIIVIIFVFMTSGIVTFYAQFSFLTEWAIQSIKKAVSGAETLDIVALHPVELLMFQAKSSVLISVLMTSIVALWLIWPDMKENSMVVIGRKNMISYVLPPVTVVSASFLIGFLYVSPSTLEILVADANRIGADIAYQISNFFWIVIYVSMGFSGILTTYVTVLYLYFRGISYQKLSSYWRHTVFAVLILSMFVTPDSITKSLLLATPISASLVLGILSVRIINPVVQKLN